MRGIKLLLVAVTMIAMVGCSEQVAKKEARQYSTEAAEEGNEQLRSAGKGIHGDVMEELENAFKDKGIVLTNERYFDDNEAAMIYKYQIEQNHELFIEAYFFNNEQDQEHLLSELNLPPGKTETDSQLKEVFTNSNLALVYRSAGESKGRYHEEASKILSQLVKDRAESGTGQ